MALAFTPIAWSTFGPFAFQTSRLIFYAVYFLAGIAVGAGGLQQGLLAPDGRLARRWAVWLLAALLAFGMALVLGILIMTSHVGSKPWETVGGFAFVLSSAASSFAFLAFFVRFAAAALASAAAVPASFQRAPDRLALVSTRRSPASDLYTVQPADLSFCEATKA